jgi:alcohol dehydrogenase class IV
LSFEFATATRIVFGSGTLKQIGRHAAGMGRRVLVVGGGTLERLEPLLALLQAEGLETHVFQVAGEPTLQRVTEGTAQARALHCDLVIGMGGGSVLDAGKAIAALLTNPGEPLDYLEIVGANKPLTQPSAPYIAIPTTAGTGAEVTRNAVLGVPERRAKVSLRSPHMLPRLALIDPDLTLGVPPEVTANTGLDALTQCLEPFVSRQANPLTDAFCREGLRRAARALRRAFHDGQNLEARSDMALASLCGGLALANAKLGAVHGFAAPLGGMFPAPHGAACARLLPLVMEANVRALRERQPDDPALKRYDEVAQMLTGNRDATAELGVQWVRDLCTELEVLPLSSYGVTAHDVPEIAAKAQQASSMAGNPLELTLDELTGILRRAL